MGKIPDISLVAQYKFNCVLCFILLVIFYVSKFGKYSSEPSLMLDMFTVLEAYQTGDTATAETVAWSTAKGTGTAKRWLRGRGQRAAGWGGVFCQSVEGQCKVWVDNCQVWAGHEHKSALFPMNSYQGSISRVKTLPELPEYVAQILLNSAVKATKENTD